MATKKYILPLVEVTYCELGHALMISEPTPATQGGPGLNSAPKRKVF